MNNFLKYERGLVFLANSVILTDFKTAQLTNILNVYRYIITKLLK